MRQNHREPTWGWKTAWLPFALFTTPAAAILLPPVATAATGDPDGLGLPINLTNPHVRCGVAQLDGKLLSRAPTWPDSKSIKLWTMSSLRRRTRRSSASRVVILTQYGAPGLRADASRAGASAYVLKDNLAALTQIFPAGVNASSFDGQQIKP